MAQNGKHEIHEIKEWGESGASSEYTPLEDYSTKELIASLKSHAKTLVQEEVRLAKLELTNAKQSLVVEADGARDVLDAGRELVSEGQARLRMDVALVKRDLADDLREAKKGGASLASGGVLAHAGLYLLLFAAVFALDLALPLWASALIVGAVVGGVGAVLAWSGKERLSHVGQKPMQRINQRVKEDKRWVNDSTSSLTAQVRHSIRGFKALMRETSETMRRVRSGGNASV